MSHIRRDSFTIYSFSPTWAQPRGLWRIVILGASVLTTSVAYGIFGVGSEAGTHPRQNPSASTYLGVRA